MTNTMPDNRENINGASAEQQHTAGSAPNNQAKKPYNAPASQVIGSIGKWLLIIITAIILLIAGIAYLAVRMVSKTEAALEVNQSIEPTATQVASMKQIGEWEFLAIADEELIDTVRPGLFSDDELIRIYYGTLRLGVNMHKAKPHFVTRSQDTVIVTLPPVELLDEDFIDEARTQSFYESGTWSDRAREEMYRRAVARMKARCLNESNLQSAQQNATSQFRQLMRSMGYDNVQIRFEQPPTEKPKSNV